MGKLEVTADKKQAGFTLVELAVVMIIIGLLIGGVLKGQELIANAQVASTVSQIKGVDAAVSTFRDTYSAVPGDMINAAGAAGRLPNCTAAPCVNGNGDGRLGVLPNAAGANAGESLAFWAHLNAADLVAGVQNVNTATFGQALPASPVGGGLVAGFTNTGAIAGQTSAANPRGGLYVVLRSQPGAPAAAANAAITTTQAARIDRKMDDGSPNGGTVVAIGAAAGTGAGNCASATTPVGVYNEGTNGLDCSIAVRIQQ